MAVSRNAAQFVARFNAKMARLPQAAREEIKRSYSTEAQRITAQMRAAIRRKSGLAASTIKWEASKKFDLAVRITAGGKATMKDPRKIGVAERIRHAATGKPVKKWDYTRGLEFGTKPHINGGVFRGTRHPGARKFPFFYAAAKKGKTAASRATKARVKAVIRSIATQ